jgi:sensor domain CHASE-containing protein
VKIRSKTLLILGIAFIFLFACLIATTELIIGNSFDKLENKEISRNIERANAALNTEIYYMETLALSWAPWDDTYKFAQGEYDEYIDSNLNSETLANMNTNMMLYYDTSNQLYYAAGVDIETYEEIEVSAAVLDHISSKEVLFSHPTPYSIVSGIIYTPEESLIVASCPITKSSGEGTIAGTLVVARYVDQALIEELK